MDIDSIPKKYGGNLDFECGNMPVLDSAVKNVLDLASPDQERLFLTAPVKWIDDVDGDMTAVGVGSVDGKERREKVATLHAFAKLALSRSNRPRMERAPTNVQAPQALSTLEPPDTLDGTRIPQQHSAQQDPTAHSGTSNPQAEPVPQLHQVSETRVPIKELASNLRITSETQPVPQSHAITNNQLSQVNGVVPTESAPPVQATTNGRAPQSIAMPPLKIERTLSEFVTPAEEPSQIQAFP